MSNLSIKGIIGGDDFIVETVLTGLSRSENLSEYWIVAQNEGRCEELRKKYNINATTDMNFISNASVLILEFTLNMFDVLNAYDIPFRSVIVSAGEAPVNVLYAISTSL